MAQQRRIGRHPITGDIIDVKGGWLTDEEKHQVRQQIERLSVPPVGVGPHLEALGLPQSVLPSLQELQAARAAGIETALDTSTERRIDHHFGHLLPVVTSVDEPRLRMAALLEDRRIPPRRRAPTYEQRAARREAREQRKAANAAGWPSAWLPQHCLEWGLRGASPEHARAWHEAGWAASAVLFTEPESLEELGWSWLELAGMDSPPDASAWMAATEGEAPDPSDVVLCQRAGLRPGALARANDTNDDEFLVEILAALATIPDSSYADLITCLNHGFPLALSACLCAHALVHDSDDDCDTQVARVLEHLANCDCDETRLTGVFDSIRSEPFPEPAKPWTACVDGIQISAENDGTTVSWTGHQHRSRGTGTALALVRVHHPQVSVMEQADSVGAGEYLCSWFGDLEGFEPDGADDENLGEDADEFPSSVWEAYEGGGCLAEFNYEIEGGSGSPGSDDSGVSVLFEHGGRLWVGHSDPGEIEPAESDNPTVAVLEFIASFTGERPGYLIGSLSWQPAFDDAVRRAFPQLPPRTTT